ncbi:keratin, type II cytoskeletal 8-like isoform X1 [Lates japonicus]|uniref:Keratin, type II cytoskeletal 8-like isoform X1 n=1 Tax=Lates japonicus TaxID=270547 RepID=A0AAD3RIB8_LATJO|nr:keratin, type II cytoskeletal 8-like isoform X1 [Lates japonicus]
MTSRGQNLASERENPMVKLDSQEIKAWSQTSRTDGDLCLTTANALLDMDAHHQSASRLSMPTWSLLQGGGPQWNQRRWMPLVLNVGTTSRKCDLKREISDMVRYIQRLNGDLDVLIRKRRLSKKDITHYWPIEGLNILKAWRTSQLEEALRRAKQDLLADPQSRADEPEVGS